MRGIFAIPPGGAPKPRRHFNGEFSSAGNMPFLKEEVETKGGRIHIREVNTFTDLFPDYDLVINCSGVGARELANDQEVFPI